MALTQAQITTAYQNVLQRSPSAGELNSFFSASQSGALTDSQVYTSIITSPEASVGPFSVIRFYQAAFGRVPDQGGLDQQVDTYNVNGNNLKAIGAGFTQSLEFTNRYGTDQSVSVAYLQSLYVNVLGRTGSSAEIQAWQTAVATPGSGYTSRADVLFGFAQSGEFIQASNTGVINFLTGAAQGQGTYTGPLPVAGNVGTNFVLTVGNDSLTGTSGNDTFIAGVSATASDNTIGLVDTINGAAGNDTLSITAAVLAADIAVPAANIQSVETFNIRAVDADGTVGADAATVNAASFTGLTAVNSDRSTSNLKVTGLANGASVGIIGDGNVANGTLSYQYATATADQVINLSGGTNNSAVANITATASTGVTKATISSTGAANSVDVIKLDSAGANTVTSLTVNAATNLTATLTATDFAATSTLTVAGGATSVNLGTAGNFKTIDASGLTAGGLTIAAGTNTTSLKGGAGNDVITTAAVAATAAGSIDAGAGTADVLNVAVGTDIDIAAEGILYSNFEVLRNSGATDLDVSLIAGITSVQLNSANAGATKLNATQAAAITNRTDNGSNTFSLATATGTADVLRVTVENTTAAASADLTAATVTGFETVQLVSSSGAAGDINTVSFAAAEDLTTLTLSGAFPISVSTTNIVKAATIDASAVTFVGPTATDYALTLSGNLIKGSTVTGSGAADSITTTATVVGTSGEYVNYNAGAGNDLITTSLAALNNTSAANASLKIDGGAGIDTVAFGTTDTTFVDANFQYVTGVEKITVGSTTSLSLTSGGFFDNNFKASGVELTAAGIANGSTATINLSSFTGAAKIALTTVADGASTADNVAITTGSGADDVTVTASSFVGAAGAAGAITVATGLGNDKISVTTGTLLAVTGTDPVTINAGAGADTITAVHTNASSALGNFVFTIADGDSLAASRDKISGFDLGVAATTIADTLNLEGTPTVAANTAGTNGTDSGTLKSHAIADGIITFGTADTFATAVVINQTNLNDALGYAATNITTAGNVVAFGFDSDNSGTADATIVFQQGASDTVVEFVGVVGLVVSATNATTAGLIDLA